MLQIACLLVLLFEGVHLADDARVPGESNGGFRGHRGHHPAQGGHHQARDEVAQGTGRYASSQYIEAQGGASIEMAREYIEQQRESSLLLAAEERGVDGTGYSGEPLDVFIERQVWALCSKAFPAADNQDHVHEVPACVAQQLTGILQKQADMLHKLLERTPWIEDDNMLELVNEVLISSTHGFHRQPDRDARREHEARVSDISLEALHAMEMQDGEWKEEEAHWAPGTDGDAQDRCQQRPVDSGDAERCRRLAVRTETPASKARRRAAMRRSRALTRSASMLLPFAGAKLHCVDSAVPAFERSFFFPSANARRGRCGS